MAAPRYQARDIPLGLTPKDWLAQNVMSYEDAAKEAASLQKLEADASNAEILNDKAKKTKEADDTLSADYTKGLQDKQDAGDTEGYTPDELINMANKRDISSGNADAVAKREIDKIQADALAEYRKQLSEERDKPKTMSHSPYTDLVSVGDDGTVTTLQSAREKPSSKKSDFPKTLINMETGDTTTVHDESEEGQANDNGYDNEVSKKISAGDVADAKAFGTLRGKSNKDVNIEDLIKSRAAPENQDATIPTPPEGFTVPPGYKAQFNRKTGQWRTVPGGN